MNSLSVSRKHCKLVLLKRETENFYIIDNKSKFGTFLRLSKEEITIEESITLKFMNMIIVISISEEFF